MTARHFPPGRTSSSTTGVVKFLGPHHCPAALGSANAFHTSSRGASNTRVITSSRLPAPDALSTALSFAAMQFLLGLNLTEVLVQAIEAQLPHAAITLHPIGDVLEGRQGELTGTPLRLAPARDEARALEHLEVLRDSGQAHVEGLSQFRHGALARRQAGEDRAPSRVGERGECEAEMIGWHCT